MDPTVAPPLRPSSATITTSTTNNFLHSIQSTEDTSTHPSHHASSASVTATATATAASVSSLKLRLMCSNGGHIVPRPHDKTLCYVGGETRMVVVDRHTTLQNLTNRLSKTLLRSSCSSPASSSFTLKYQLPSEDLDSLISVTTDEDLENMIEEYERLNSSSSSAVSKSSRLRLFLFPIKPESVTSITSFLESSVKSEDWFLNALNGTDSGFSDTSSVNYLLGLDDEISHKKDVNYKTAIATNLRGNNSGQDVHSIPDSAMMETTSSFGSASSTPSLKLNVDDHHHKHQNDVGFVALPTPVTVSGYVKDQQLFQQKQSTGFDLVSSDSVLSDCNITDQLSQVLQFQSSSSNNQATDPNEIQIQQQQQQQIQNSPYLLSIPTTQQQQQQQQQLQFIHTAAPPPPQYIHHHHPSPGVVPVAPYYQMYQSQGHHHPQNPTMGQQNFVYYMPHHQGYNFPLQQQQGRDADAHASPKTDFPTDVYRRTNSGPPQLMRVPSGNYEHIYYGKQGMPMPPHSADQYQTVTSTEQP